MQQKAIRPGQAAPDRENPPPPPPDEEADERPRDPAQRGDPRLAGRAPLDLRGQQLRVDLLDPSPFQARQVFDDLDALAAGMREQGFITRLLVRPHPTEPKRFQIVCGERRWRAAQQAGLTQVPVDIVNYNDAQMIEVGLLENLQRRDLSPLEEADSFAQLLGTGGYSIRRLAARLGKPKSYIEDRVSLHRLPADLRALVAARPNTLRTARELAKLPTPEARAPWVAQVLAEAISCAEVRRAMAQRGEQPGSQEMGDVGSAGVVCRPEAERLRPDENAAAAPPGVSEPEVAPVSPTAKAAASTILSEPEAAPLGSAAQLAPAASPAAMPGMPGAGLGGADTGLAPSSPIPLQPALPLADALPALARPAGQGETPLPLAGYSAASRAGAGIAVQLHAPSEAALAWICERVAAACGASLTWATAADAEGWQAVGMVPVPLVGIPGGGLADGADCP